MTTTNADVLRAVPLFAGVDTEVLDRLAAQCERRFHQRGDTVWTVGDAGDELVVVISGSLDVLGAGGASGPVARLGPGEYAGELALLLDESRSATVTCSRATELLSVPKAAFRELVRSDATVLPQLTELISRRAVALARSEAPASPPVVVGVVATGEARGAHLVAGAIAELGAGMVPALLVRVVAGAPALVSVTEAPLQKPVSAAGGSAPGAAARLEVDLDLGAGDLLRLVEHLVTRTPPAARLIVIDLPRGAADAAGAACDAVVVVSDDPAKAGAAAAGVSGGARVRHEVVNLHPRRNVGTGPLHHSEPFFLRHEPALRGCDVDAAVAALVATPTLPAARVLGRLTRKLLGVSVGLALGGGAAFGIAHVGILLALEEAGLPVDVVAGTSMGSIIAIAHAAGLSGEDMREIAGRIGNVRTTLSVLDPTLSGAGLLNGRRLVSIFAPLLSVERFDDLVTPCRVVAMDVETGERVDIGSGRLDQAFRASCSIPLVFTPVKDGDRTLVDGGMIDPVPVDVARDMGADIVVGVNVVPKLERGVSTALSRTFKAVNRLNPLARFGGGRGLPDLVDVLMNSLQVVEYELGEYKQRAADVQVAVPLAEFTWIEFYRALEIIERGREAGQEAVAGLRSELERRLAVAG